MDLWGEWLRLGPDAGGLYVQSTCGWLLWHLLHMCQYLQHCLLHLPSLYLQQISSEMAGTDIGAWYWGSVYPGHIDMLGKNANIGLFGLWEHIASL